MNKNRAIEIIGLAIILNAMLLALFGDLHLMPTSNVPTKEAMTAAGIAYIKYHL